MAQRRHDADDLDLERLALRPETDPLADRVAIAPVALGQRFGDHRDVGALGSVAVVEAPAADDGDAHGAEIARCGGVERPAWLLTHCRHRVADDLEDAADVDVRLDERHRGHRAGGVDARERGDAAERSVEEPA